MEHKSSKGKEKENQTEKIFQRIMAKVSKLVENYKLTGPRSLWISSKRDLENNFAKEHYNQITSGYQ